jgi:glycosyltransferase involved in cell wall biosynthesis
MTKMMKWADVVYIPRFWYSAIPLAKAYGKPVITHLHDYIPVCPLSNIYDVSKDTVCDHNSLLCPSRCIYVYEKTQGRGFTETLTSIALNSTLGRYFGKFVKFSDAVICVSKAQRNIITKAASSLRAKIHVIYNPLPELNLIGIEGNDFGYFEGPNPLKGFHILRRALTCINDRQEAKVHATNFPNRAKMEYESLSHMGIILYGRLNDNLYERICKKICAVIVPSIWPETFSYVSAEAILRGRLLIAFNIGGIPEVTEDCKGAFLFEPGNYRQLAEKLEYINNLSREVIIDLGAKNKENLTKRFNNRAIISNFANICDSLL